MKVKQLSVLDERLASRYRQISNEYSTSACDTKVLRSDYIYRCDSGLIVIRQSVSQCR